MRFSWLYSLHSAYPPKPVILVFAERTFCREKQKGTNTLIVSILTFLMLLISLSSTFAEKQEIYEVTATPLAYKKNDESIITRKEIETYQETFLKDALPYTPSIILNSRGSVGRQVDFSIRGARSPQNLVLLDGIHINDPASGGGVDLSNFLNADLERIEVLAGPHTLAYGPGALGGVVQLIPKRGQGNPSYKVHGEKGSFNTNYGTVTAQGEDGPFQIATTFAGFKRGPSSFTNPLHGNRQSDRYGNGTVSSRIGYNVTDNWEVEGLVRYTESEVQFDTSKFIPKEKTYLPFKAKNYSDTETFLSSLENKWGNNMQEHALKATYSRTQRETTMPAFHNHTLGEHPLLSYRSSFKLTSRHTLMGGLDGGQERAKEKELHTRSHGGVFLIHNFKLFETTLLKAGVRGDRYQSLGGRFTFNVGADQKITPTTTLHTSYGTNFKPPILSDLFQKNSPWQVPNPFLKPEKSKSFEAGIDQLYFENTLKISLTGFLTRIEQITLSRRLSNGKWQRFNGGHRESKGLEMAFSLKPEKNIELKTAFTLTHSRDFPHKKKSPFIPTFKGAGGLHWQAQSDLSFFVQGYVVTAREDDTAKRRLAPYGVIHVGSAYDFTKHASFFWRIENLTNKRYEEVFGYGVRGRAFFIGIEAKT